MQRPFWLPLLYIAMMGIGFWYRGMGLPWFMKYLVQAAVVGLASSPETLTDCPSSRNITSSFSSPL